MSADTTTPSASALRDRLARLDPDQLARLVTGLQTRLDALRAEASPPPPRVAVVGVGCRFPGAPDLAAFRRLLEEGRDAVAAPPADRPERDGLPPGGYLDSIDRFDAGFFGIRAAEAAQMDPQHRLVLEVAWHALEDAGMADRHRRPPATGIFLGISTHDYEARFQAAGFTPQATTGNAASAAAGRLAHLLDVTGPALVLDTACSSSLVAVLAACRSLRLGECDLAIAGGVNLLVGDALTRGFAAAGMLSPSHACRTFAAAADGYVRGEGGGFLVLKRLPDAERDGDRVRAVIRGGAVNHDGRAASLTAPNASAQVALVRAALADAGLSPAEVQAVECHGTGTPLGDPIEVQALAEAYGAGRAEPLLLGAVKTNIGHLEAAAGIAGLIKTVLALESAHLPPTLHQGAPNPRIAWDRLPVRVVDAARDWPGSAGPRRAGVSSFGFSGTNAHLILESVEPRAVADSAAPLVLPLSAPDAAGLSRLAEAVAQTLSLEGRGGVRALATALAIGRAPFAERVAVVAEDAAGLVAGLRAVAAGEVLAPGARGTAPATPPKIAFLFTGQGSHWPGMGRDLYESDARFRAVVDRCAAIIDPLIGRSLTAAMFDADGADALTDTRLAQPALFTLGYALAERLADWGIVPDVMIGHSLGEWIAACRAEIFTLEDALRLVVARGRLMADASPDGAMAAVFAGPEVLDTLPAELRAAVDLAAINAPDECVVSGPAAAVAAVCAALDARGVGTQPLRTAHGFHSRLMEPALDAFGAALRGITLSAPTVPLVSNLTGGTDAPFATPGYWVRHIREPVRFADGVAALAATGCAVLVEIGASPVLTGMASRAPAFADRPPALAATLRRNQPARRTLGALLAQLHVAGVPVRWESVYEPAERGDAPGYPFAGERHWHAMAPMTAVAAGPSPESLSSAPPSSHPLSHAGRAASAPAPEDRRAEAGAVLARALQLAPADAESDRGFLELGVDSLALTEAVAALERRWGLAIPRRALFETLNTPRRLIDHVAEAAPTTPAASTAPTPSQPAAVTTPTLSAPTPAAPPIPPEAAAGLASFAADYTARTAASREQRTRFGASLADSRAVAGFRAETKGMLYPIVGARGTGSRLVDVDGNAYVDIAMGFGVQLFGHNPPFVADAIARHMTERGLFLGPQAPLAGAVAERLCRLTGNARAAFCNSGTEAVMTALRLARHATGRRRVALFQGSYHGHFDGTLAQAGPGGVAVPLAGGTPPGMLEDVLLLDYGDEDGALEAIAREGETLAAVLVEPVQGRRPDRQPRAFLQRLRALTRSQGTALIFDEVLLGFRVALGGAQAWADVRADLVTYGKIVGGGLPIGVVAGEARYLDALDGGAWSLDGPADGDGGPRGERTFFAGTFNKNPLTMAVSDAVLSHLEAAGPALQETLNARAAAFADRLNRLLEGEETGIAVHRFASLFRFVGAGDLFYNHMIRNGVYVWEGRTCFLSTAHDESDLDRVEEAVLASVRAMRAAHLMPPQRYADAPESLPTTAGQAALRLLAAFSPQASAAYNQSLVLDLAGPLDADALAAALRAVVDRHEALRTTFPADGASQILHRRLEPAIHRVDRSGEDAAALRAWMDEAALTPFDLETGPLVAAWIVRLGEDRHRLLIVMPHLVTDGWSMQAIALELAELYSARREERPADLPAPVPFRRYVEHTGTAAERPEQGAYWRALFATVPAPLDLPADRPRPPIQGYAGARATRRLPADLAARLAEAARRAGCSLFTLGLAAYARLLNRLSGRDEAVVAIFSAGQPELAAPTLVGYCVGVLPLRLAAGPTVDDAALLAATQRAVVDGVAHRDYPFARIVKDLGLRRDPRRPPLATVSFNLDRAEEAPRFAGLTTTLDANGHGAVRWDLNWNLTVDGEGVRVDATYSRHLFDAPRVEGWLDAYATILDALAGGKRAPAPATGVESLAARVARHAALTPAAPAVRDRDGVVDYAGLDVRAAALARRLMDAGVKAGDRVAFRLPRGLGPVVAMLAAARLGAAFVPLDADHPDSHHADVLADSGATALVVEPGSRPAPGAVTAVVWSRDDADAAGAPAPRRVAPTDIAYVLYTSGSTGRPKGVRVPCGAVAAYVAAMLERLDEPAPVSFAPVSFAMVSSVAADLGYTAVLGALWSGGALHAMDAETARDPAALQGWMRQTPVDALKIVPAHLAALLDSPDARDLLPRRALILGGDTLTWGLVARIRALGGACRIFNHYGPTETTVGACMTEALDRLRDEGATAVPIGPPLAGYRVAILDPHGNPVPDGTEGEIVIAGAGVAAGYTRAEPAGRERFGTGADGRPLYRTGDLGHRRADGAIVFHGRGDDMVKIRGHRIEPAGLAERLRGHPDVRDATVLVQRAEGREPSLLAAVAGDVAPEALAAWLAERVPAAMVPARILVCHALPLTTNGKVDRQALLASAAPDAGPPVAATAASAPPAVAEEGDARVALIQGLWRAVLNRDAVGPDDDFFALGGDSIMAIQIVGRARAAGLGLTPTQVFQAPTPRGQARLAVPLDAGTAGVEPVAGPVPLTPIQRWFLETPMPDRRRWCLTAVFALPFAVTAERLRAALAAAVARHDALRVRWDMTSGEPVQRVGAPVPPVVLAQDGTALLGDALRAAEDALADRLMDTLDPAAGRMLAAGLIAPAGGDAARLVVAVHHGVFDMVSWPILAGDLHAALTGADATARPASTSWSWWANALSRRRDAALAERPHWTGVAEEAARAVALPTDHPDAANREGDTRESRLRLPADRTERFLSGMATVFGLRAHEAVLAATGRALARWAGGPLAVELEGHGRQPFEAAIDLSRTIGWFTTRYPAVLPDPKGADPGGWVVALKESLRRIPDGGIGYGLLVQGGPGGGPAGPRVEPAASFNFVGELGQFGGDGLPLLRLGAGRERAADAGRRHLLAFDVWLEGGALCLSCRFAAAHEAATVDALLAAVDAEVGHLTAACGGAATAVYTPSDFTGMDFSQDELDLLVGELEGLADPPPP